MVVDGGVRGGLGRVGVFGAFSTKTGCGDESGMSRSMKIGRWCKLWWSEKSPVAGKLAGGGEGGRPVVGVKEREREV